MIKGKYIGATDIAIAKVDSPIKNFSFKLLYSFIFDFKDFRRYKSTKMKLKKNTKKQNPIVKNIIFTTFASKNVTLSNKYTNGTPGRINTTNDKTINCHVIEANFSLKMSLINSRSILISYLFFSTILF